VANKDLDYLWGRIAVTDHENKTLNEQLGLLRQEYSKLETQVMHLQSELAALREEHASRDEHDEVVKDLEELVSKYGIGRGY
jgi:predicted  nucleic acid-binding Zn-ribbon protein